MVRIFGGIRHHTEYIAQHHAGADADARLQDVVNRLRSRRFDGKEEGNNRAYGNDRESNAADGTLVFDLGNQIADRKCTNHAADRPDGLGVGVQQIIACIVRTEVQTEGHTALNDAPAEIRNRDLDDWPVALEDFKLLDKADLFRFLHVHLDDFLGGQDGDDEERRCEEREYNGCALVTGRAAASRVDDTQGREGQHGHGQECAGHTVAGQCAAGLGVAGHQSRHRRVGYVYHGVQQHEDKVHAQAPPGAHGFRPFEVGGKGQDVEDQHRDKREHNPGTIATPTGVGPVGQRANDRVVDRVPELGQKDDDIDNGCIDQRNVGQIEDQIRAYQRPAHITGKVTAGISHFLGDTQFGIFINRFHGPPPSLFHMKF